MAMVTVAKVAVENTTYQFDKAFDYLVPQHLLKQAKEAGCPHFNGLYMLLYQGAAAFTCWTGKEMPVEPIKEKYFKK